MRIARSSIVLVFVLAACGAASDPSSSPSESAAASAPGPSAPDGASPPGGSSAPGGGSVVWLPEWADENVPDEVANRAPLRFCGIEQAPAPVPGEFIDAVVRACFWNAWQDGGQAEFASVQSTMEGDPIATIYRLNGDGTIDVLVDGSQDQFGSGGWTVTRCTRLVEDTEGNAFFGVDGCDEGRSVG